MRKAGNYLTLLIFLTVLFVGNSEGQSAPKGQMVCPNVVANTKSKQFKNLKKDKTALCFRTANDAKKAGYKNENNNSDELVQGTFDFTGWYRLKLGKTVQDTCGSFFPIGLGALFLQITQNGLMVNGSFCPDIGSFSGYRKDSKVMLSAYVNTTSRPSFFVCNGIVSRREFVTVEEVIPGGGAFNSSYTIITQCTEGTRITNSCIQEFSGVAFAETHEFWPEVSYDQNYLAKGCAEAQKSCSKCHSEL